MRSLKVINIKGIIILAAGLLVFQVAFGLVVSPIVSSVVVDKLNECSEVPEGCEAKISVEKVNIWPLTLSCSLKGLKVFDPDDQAERIAAVRGVSVRISPIALLSKRLVISRISVSGAEINLKGEPDGSFNVMKLARGKEEEKEPVKKWGILDRFKGKKDWFTRVYDMVKKKSSEEAIEKEAAERKKRRKIEKEIEELPRGRRVKFLTARDRYILEIRSLSIKNASVHVEADGGRTLDIEKAGIKLRGVAIDPEKGGRCDRCSIKGLIKKEGISAGSFKLAYAQSSKRGEHRTECDLTAKDIDLAAVSFIYESSLPVALTKGTMNIRSKTTIINDVLDSRNAILLSGQNFVPRRGALAVGAVPIPTLCEALNKVDPLDLKFDITGSVEKPEFKGLQDNLLKVAKPYLDEAMEDVKKKGLDAITDLFGGKDDQEKI